MVTSLVAVGAPPPPLTPLVAASTPPTLYFAGKSMLRSVPSASLIDMLVTLVVPIADYLMPPLNVSPVASAPTSVIFILAPIYL
eukprot:CAMPEP_0180266452 /NCGR_PEP_ID=MMETSP0988-20121125/1020_1 /TAXON_ID=697907 /ORGANISM="non described non described, Strain CCMP2293" /LENGTH=83 /DNA_ID=CAMNT_0022237059 /DNA_START=270 /DNA_END=521 /DNA_ORIENTATION=-